MWSITVSFKSTPPPDIQIDRVVAAFRNVGIVVFRSVEERNDDWVRWMSKEMVDTRDMWPIQRAPSWAIAVFRFNGRVRGGEGAGSTHYVDDVVYFETERGLHSVVIVIHNPRRTHHGYFRNLIIHQLSVPSTQTSTSPRDFLSPSGIKKNKKNKNILSKSYPTRSSAQSRKKSNLQVAWIRSIPDSTTRSTPLLSKQERLGSDQFYVFRIREWFSSWTHPDSHSKLAIVTPDYHRISITLAPVFIQGWQSHHLQAAFPPINIIWTGHRHYCT